MNLLPGLSSQAACVLISRLASDTVCLQKHSQKILFLMVYLYYTIKKEISAKLDPKFIVKLGPMVRKSWIVVYSPNVLLLTERCPLLERALMGAEPAQSDMSLSSTQTSRRDSQGEKREQEQIILGVIP